MKKYNSGFSLAELIAVIVLASIVSVTVFARLDINGFRRASFVQELKAAIRFAHKFAITSACDVQVSVIAGSESYAVNLRSDAVASPVNCFTASGAFSVPLNNPASSGGFSGAAPSGVDITTGLTWFYDQRGRPSSGGNIMVDGQSLTIEAETGLVY